MTAEEKAKDFLRYVALHHERLRRNLAKNVTYDAEIFENAFQDTVIRVHDAIIRNNPEIGSYEQYFFQASRKRYLTLSDKDRRKREREQRLGDTGCDAVAEEPPRRVSVAEVYRLLEAEFGSGDAGLFLDYLGSKSMGRTSYHKFGKETGIPSMKIKDAVIKIKRHLRKRYPRGLTSERCGEETARIIEERIRKQFEDGIHREEEKDTPEGKQG